MDNREKARISIEKAVGLLREKPPESALVERYFLLADAWERVKDLPQALQLGMGLYDMLSKASLPICEYDILLGRYDDHVPTAREEERLKKIWAEIDLYENPITRYNYGHTTFDWETVVFGGIPAYIAKCEAQIQYAGANGEDENVLNFLDGMLWVYKAVLCYIGRYGEAAHKAGMSDCARVCANLTTGAPQSFREAMQLILFIYNIHLIYSGSGVDCISVGRLDDLLLPLYLNDLKEGRLTEEEAGYIIDDFSAKMSLHLGRGEHQMAYLNEDYVHTGWDRNHVYDSPGYIVLGGHSNRCDHRENPLTLLFARHIHPELKNPIYICRHTADRSDALWDILSEKIQKNASILIYNDETMIPAQCHIGVEKHDAVNYGIHPCNWPDIEGGYGIVDMVGGPIPHLINDVLERHTEIGSMDDIYRMIAEQFRNILRPCFDAYRKTYRDSTPPSDGQLSVTDCFMRGTIEKMRGIERGGAKYPAIYVLVRNIGTATDMLCAVQQLVHEQKICTLAELVGATKDNFETRTDLLGECKKAPKYGTDNPAADTQMEKIMNLLLDVIDEEATNGAGVRDVITLNIALNDSNHLRDGEEMGATVDGRRAGEPLSENLAPSVGSAPALTSLLNSAAKLPFDRIHSGVLNVKLTPGKTTDPALIKLLIDTYFGQGGMQLQFSIVDNEMLRRAQQLPDQHRDVLVRITGYSAIFVDMSKGAQEEFIRREELR